MKLVIILSMITVFIGSTRSSEVKYLPDGTQVEHFGLCEMVPPEAMSECDINNPHWTYVNSTNECTPIDVNCGLQRRTDGSFARYNNFFKILVQCEKTCIDKQT